MTDSEVTLRRPDGLKARGRRFWDLVTGTYELTDAERALLPEVCRALDVVEDLARRSRARDVDDASRLSLYREQRLQRLALGRLLAQLQLPGEDARTMDSPSTARARKAANVRWGEFRREYGDGTA